MQHLQTICNAMPHASHKKNPFFRSFNFQITHRLNKISKISVKRASYLLKFFNLRSPSNILPHNLKSRSTSRQAKIFARNDSTKPRNQETKKPSGFQALDRQTPVMK